ncbi:hypothetical protein [Metallibacterium sp.]|uniref:hypothetical protein n=1 Tax=Metallibacterium sp. TaxID=2940281 RepID=UPI00260634DA|nr:hypothetical protein [Metallibacterium sp.]
MSEARDIDGTLSETPPSTSDWPCGSTGVNTAGADMLARIASDRSPPRRFTR